MKISNNSPPAKTTRKEALLTVRPSSQTSFSMVHVEVENVTADAQVQRVAAHSHIKRLGLRPDGTAIPEAGGFVGQVEAREACGLVVSLIRQKQFSGNAVLLAGPPGTGKTALALAISHELGSNVPFSHLVGSEIFSAEVKKTEVLTTALRRSIGVRIRETKEVYEGEITQLDVVRTPAPTTGYGQTISHVIIQLRSSKGTKKLRLDPDIHEQLEREGARVGDVIYIEAHTGAVRRVGRCDVYASATDLDADEFVPLPRGDVHKKKEVTQDVTLHDLDTANARPQGGNDVLALMGQFGQQRKTEITQKLRKEVDRVVQSYIDRGVAELVPGVLFIDEVHMLDIESFAFLNGALERTLAPIVVFATNRGRSRVRGTESDVSPHGLPGDLLDRCLIIPTRPYSHSETRQIIATRAEVEGIQFTDPKALDILTDRASSAGSVRYALQLIAPSKVLAVASSNDETLPDSDQWLQAPIKVSPENIMEALTLFPDVQSLASRIESDESGFLK